MSPSKSPTVLTGRKLDRRALLRGAGAALTLPWLDAMAAASPLRSTGPAAPKRFAALFCPNGMLPSAWRPATEGAGFELPPTLEPLAPIRDSVSVLGNLRNYASRVGEGHYVKTTAWLSGAPVKRTGGRDLRVGVSIDQFLAERVGQAAPLSSLVLGVEPVRNRVDMGYSTVYGANISWRTAAIPAEREISPRRAMERLVRWSGAANGRSQRVLDLVHREGKALSARLGAADRAKLAEYLHAVDSLEKRIAAMEARDVEASPLGLDPTSAEAAETYADRVDLMLDIMVEAFRTDSTRVATFMFGNAVSGQNFSFLEGVEGGHHPLSHHEKKERKKAQYALINRWHVEQFVAFMERLGAIEEADATLDQRCAVLFGSALADGNQHNPKDLPTLLGGGLFEGGQHIRQKKLTPMCNLFTSINSAFGAGEEPFGDGSGPLEGLKVI
jgi:BMFP domain-containing protein YqiC